MNCTAKIKQLSEVIRSTLPPIIGDKCIYLDLAYYLNIGDVLIWEGTEFFLKSSGIDCIYKASKETYNPTKIPDNVTILLQGGGNFGDIWDAHQKFRLKVIENHPNNRIIILPQTIYYNNMDILKSQAHLCSLHNDLHICARDLTSEKLLKTYFSKNTIHLLPDMAFCIPSYYLNSLCSKSYIGRKLFLKRSDVELVAYDFNKYIADEVEQHDWPSYEKNTLMIRIFNRLKMGCNYLSRLNLLWILDIYCQKILKNGLIKMGVKFLSQYDYIYTTRLHVAILSVLLEKHFTFFDNSYGKNQAFFDTWLNDLEGIKFIRINKSNSSIK